MSSQPIGLYAEQLAKREGAVARLSPAARHQAFPKLYAQPLPRSDTSAELKEELLRLCADNRRLTEENRILRGQIAAAMAEVDKLHTMALPANITPRRVTCGEVLAAYVKALEAAGYQVNGMPYTIENITSPRRMRGEAWPRLVAMWLCVKLCRGATMAVIGHTFGGRDHTTILSGRRRAEPIMDAMPVLRAAALSVLATFEAKGTTP